MTLVVNLFAGPGTGKSTTASLAFGHGKLRGDNCELGHEWAKEAAWEGRKKPLFFQPYVFGKQAWRIHRLIQAGVDYIITDSPILLSLIYGKDTNLPTFSEAVVEQFRDWNTLNIFLQRDHQRKYNPNGRFQTEDEAKALDEQIERMLIHHEIDFTHVLAGPRAWEDVLLLVDEARA